MALIIYRSRNDAITVGEEAGLATWRVVAMKEIELTLKAEEDL